MAHRPVRLLLAAAAGLLCAAAVLFGLDPAPLRVASARPLANVITVTNTTDHDPGSLSAALLSANAGDTIQFNLPPNSTITLTGGELVVNQPITIDGSTAVNLAVSGNFASRVFIVSVPLTVRSLTIEFGHTTGDGGGILSTSDLTLTNVSFVLNSTTGGYGGGVFAAGAVKVNGGAFTSNSCTASLCRGGGLFAGGRLALSGTNFLANTASGPGGGALVNGAATLEGGQFAVNSCSNSQCTGGGMAVFGTLALTGTQFNANSAKLFGGGAAVQDAVTLNGGQFVANSCSASGCAGGGLHAGSTLGLSGTNFIANAAGGPGGGAVVQDVATLSGGLFELNNATAGNGGGLYVTGTLTLTGTQFLSNTAGGPNGGGGGVYALAAATVRDGLFQNNVAITNSGGGLYAFDALTLSGTQFISNSAKGYGGGLFAFNTLVLTGAQFTRNASIEGGGARAQGGATLTDGLFQNNTATQFYGGGFYASSALTLSGTQFLSNTASVDGGGLFAFNTATLNGALFRGNRCTGINCSGGGLYANLRLVLTATQFLGNAAVRGGGLAHDTGDVRVVNALFARNSAGSGQAMLLTTNGNVQILFTTIASPTVASGSAISVTGGALSIFDTIITGYTPLLAVSGTALSGDHNNSGGNLGFVDPAHDNYHLTPGSDAIDAGVDTGVYTDLDGHFRPVGGGFDVGAYEFPIALRRLFLPLIMR